MKFVPSRNLKRRRQSGLTLVEILAASALLLVIALGLTAMLLQTQRAFRSGVKQVDILDSGRAALDMIAQDIEHAAASGSFTNTSLFAGLPVADATINNTAGGGVLRTNYLQDVFVLRYATQWEGIAYRIVNPNAWDSMAFIGVGTLYR